MFSQMLSQMMAGAGGPQAGAGGAGAGPAAGANPFMQGPPMSPFPPAPKTFLDRIFPAIHLLAMVGLAVYVVAVYEPAKRLAEYGWTGAQDGIDWASWGALISRKPREAGVVADAIGLNGLAEVVRLLSRPGHSRRADSAFPASPVDVRQCRARSADDAALPPTSAFSTLFGCCQPPLSRL